MYCSNFFFHTLKEIPSEASIVSHQLMLRTSMIHQTTHGIYSWLPLGLRVLQKIIKIVKEEQNKIGCIEISMPTIQPAFLWKESERYDAYGKEMLRIKDRHEKELLYGPTHEEVVTDIMRSFIKSYRDLPKILYQISPKFRDEIRPRFGVMRAKEFIMKDGYAFDLTAEDAKLTYEKIFNSYIRIFSKMGVKAIPVSACSGAIGGDLSHEFHLIAENGESALYYDEKFESIQNLKFKDIKNFYSATDEIHHKELNPNIKIKEARGIEVGHVFYFGNKYSKSMNLKIPTSSGDFIYPEMGSYGIGISRMVAAIIESSHDQCGICWPFNVAPFHVAIINLNMKKQESCTYAQELYEKITKAGFDVLYDDRNLRAGIKFQDMDLIGIPYQIIIGSKESDLLEIKIRKTNEKLYMSIDQFINQLNSIRN